MLKRPGPRMMYYLKPLFINENVDNLVVNKVFVDGGTTVNLMSHSLFKKMGKINADLRPHDMVLSNYEGKTSHFLGVTQVEILVNSIIRPILFTVITSNANYNMLFGHKWIHGIGGPSSTLHQRVTI